jgi:hypothetical protein
LIVADDLQLTLHNLDVERFAAAHALVDESGIVVDAFGSHMLKTIVGWLGIKENRDQYTIECRQGGQYYRPPDL